MALIRTADVAKLDSQWNSSPAEILQLQNPAS